jgi:hypothetical protein
MPVCRGVRAKTWVGGNEGCVGKELGPTGLGVECGTGQGGEGGGVKQSNCCFNIGGKLGRGLGGRAQVASAGHMLFATPH